MGWGCPAGQYPQPQGNHIQLAAHHLQVECAKRDSSRQRGVVQFQELWLFLSKMEHQTALLNTPIPAINDQAESTNKTLVNMLKMNVGIIKTM